MLAAYTAIFFFHLLRDYVASEKLRLLSAAPFHAFRKWWFLGTVTFRSITRWETKRGFSIIKTFNFLKNVVFEIRANFWKTMPWEKNKIFWSLDFFKSSICLFTIGESWRFKIGLVSLPIHSLCAYRISNFENQRSPGKSSDFHADDKTTQATASNQIKKFDMYTWNWNQWNG